MDAGEAAGRARLRQPTSRALLDKILGLRVTDFVTDDAGNLAPTASPRQRHHLRHASARTSDMVLQIGGPVPGKPDQVYAQRLKSNSVFTLAKSTIDDLLKALPNVRDRHVLPFDPARPPALTFPSAPKKADLQRRPRLWNTVGDGRRPRRCRQSHRHAHPPQPV